MKKILFIFLAFTSLLFGSDEIAIECANAYKAVIRDGKVPANELVNLSKAIIVFPNFYKGGFLLGGAGGKGIMLEKTDFGWQPSGVSIGGASVGLQAGFEANKLVLFITKPEIVEDIKNAKFTVSAQMAASLGEYSTNTEQMNEISFTQSIYAYSNNAGLFAGASLGGSLISKNGDSFDPNSYGIRELINSFGNAQNTQNWQ